MHLIYQKYVLNWRKRVGKTVCFIFLSANEIFLEPIFKVLAADGRCGHSRGENIITFISKWKNSWGQWKINECRRLRINTHDTGGFFSVLIMGEKMLQFNQDFQPALFCPSLIAPLKLNNRMHKSRANADGGEKVMEVGGTLVQRLALSPLRQVGSGFVAPAFLCGACMFSLCMLGFPPTVQRHVC